MEPKELIGGTGRFDGMRGVGALVIKPTGGNSCARARCAVRPEHSRITT